MTGPGAEGDEHGHRGPLHHLVDLFVCAPIGFVLDAPSLLPRWIERGRRQTDATLQALGLARPPAPGSAPPASVERRDVAPPAEPEPTTAPAAPGPPAEPAPSGPPAESLAITDYDSLSASQVVPRLESLEPDELEIVRAYETANRGRKTILSKIAQLQGS